MERLGHAEEQPERRAQEDAQEEAFRNADETVVREQDNALVHLAAFFERLEEVQLALLPRAKRRGKVRHRLAGHEPHQSDQRDTRERQHDVQQTFRVHDML